MKKIRCIACGSSLTTWAAGGWRCHQCKNKECGFEWEEDDNGLCGWWAAGADRYTGIYVALPQGCLPILKEENP